MAAGRSASTSSSSSDAVTPQTECVYRCCCWRGPVVWRPAFTWSSCLSLTAGVSFLLLHFVPVLFTFCWILPSADTVLCLCAVFEMTHNAKCWLNWEALSVHCPPSCVIVSAGWVLVQGSGGGVIWMKRDWWPLIHVNKALYTQVLKDHFTQNHTNHCPLMP